MELAVMWILKPVCYTGKMSVKMLRHQLFVICNSFPDINTVDIASVLS